MKGSGVVNNNIRSTTEKKPTKIMDDRKGKDGGDNIDVNACESEATKPKGDATKKKKQRTAHQKIAYITKWKEIEALFPGRKNAVQKDKLKTEFALEMEGSFNYKSISILHDQVGVWIKQEERIRHLVEIGKGSTMRVKGNTSSNGVISLQPDFDDKIISKLKMDVFVKSLKGASHYMDQIGTPINGATMMEWSMGEKNSKLHLLLNHIKNETRRADWITLNDLENYLVFRLEKNSIFLELGIEMTSIALVINDPHSEKNESHMTSSSTHSDVMNTCAELNNFGWGEQIQGSLLLTPSHSTIAHNMDGVPFNPSLHECMAAMMKDNKTDISINDISTFLGSSEDIKELIRNWGRLLYTNKGNTPKRTMAKQYSMTVMHGNHPHKSPGSNELRLIIFFTGRRRGSDIKPYGGSQMTKPKLILKMIQQLRFEHEEKNIKEDHVVLAYLYNCFAAATISDLFSHSFDGTLLEDNPTKFDFKNQNWLRLFNNLVTCCEIYLASKSNYNLERMKLSKSMFANYWAQLNVYQPQQPKKRKADKKDRRNTTTKKK